MAKVSYCDTAGMAKEHVLGERTTIGRHPEQILQILDRIMSKEHAVIHRNAHGAYFIQDAGSRNGTHVNGELVVGRRRLHHGDIINLGTTELVFHQDSDDTKVHTSVTDMKAKLDTSTLKSRVSSKIDEHFLPEKDIQDIVLLRRDYEKLRSAHELSQSIGIEMDLNVLLEKILVKALEVFPADRAAILITDEHSGELVPMLAQAKEGGKVSPHDVPISSTILSEVVEEKQAILSSDAMMDSRFSGAHSIVIGNIRSTMSVPLLHESKILGVIHLDSKFASGVFTEKDLQIITGFARQAAMLVEHHRLLKKMEEEIVAREKLHRLLSPQLVEEVVSGRLELVKGGQLRKATIMFADIRNFTSISENVPPQELVTLLNEYFELMVDIIFKYQGTLDKFIGDEIMAIWGAPIGHDDDAERAVQCAIEMQQSLEIFNATRLSHTPLNLRIGIGLNTGEVVAGYMGSTKSMNYTVMGDTVNIASRLCSTAHEQEILIGQDTCKHVQHLVDYEKLPPTKLKGKLEHVDIFRIKALR